MNILQTPTFARQVKKIKTNQKKDLDVAIEKYVFSCYSLRIFFHTFLAKGGRHQICNLKWKRGIIKVSSSYFSPFL